MKYESKWACSGFQGPGFRMWLSWFLAVAFAIYPFCLKARAQTFHITQESADILNGCARLVPDLFSAGSNPAVLGTTRQPRVTFSAEDQWALPELSYSRVLAAVRAGGGALGLGLQHSGNTAYQESGLDLGYGLSLGHTDLGIMMQYRSFRALGYGPGSSMAAVAGLRLQLLPDLITGLSFSVPFSLLKTGNHADKPAGNYRIELGFLASAQVSLFATWIKTDGLTAAVEVGVDYAFADHFFFVTGLHGRTGAPFGKAGWAANGWRITIFTAYQAPLGFSPGLSFSWDRPSGTSKKDKGKPGNEKEPKPALP